MNIFFAIVAALGISGALFYGFRKRKESKQRYKDKIDKMSPEDRQAYDASIEQKQAEYLEEIRKRP